MHVQEEVEGQNVNSHKFFPSLLIWVICILFGVYKFLNGRVRKSQNKYVSKKKKCSIQELNRGPHNIIVV